MVQSSIGWGGTWLMQTGKVDILRGKPVRSVLRQLKQEKNCSRDAQCYVVRKKSSVVHFIHDDVFMMFGHVHRWPTRTNLEFWGTRGGSRLTRFGQFAVVVALTTAMPRTAKGCPCLFACAVDIRYA